MLRPDGVADPFSIPALVWADYSIKTPRPDLTSASAAFVDCLVRIRLHSAVAKLQSTARRCRHHAEHRCCAGGSAAANTRLRLRDRSTTAANLAVPVAAKP